MSKLVFDASAALAHLHKEPGGDVFGRDSADGALSAVNHAEVFANLIEHGVTFDQASYTLERLGYDVLEADQHRAQEAGALLARVRRRGVSLADAFCLSFARELGLPAVTGDRKWKTLDLGVEVTLIR